MNYPAWQFRKMSKGEMNIDPIEGEFFSTEALGDPGCCGLRCITNPNCLSLINNRAGGNAILIGQKIADRLRSEKQGGLYNPTSNS